MNWLRAILRKWLCPELLELGRTKYEIKQIMKNICEVKEEVTETLVAIENRNANVTVVAEERLKRVATEHIKILKHLHKTMLEEVNIEVASMFFVFPGKKRVYVKSILKLLLNYLKLEIYLCNRKNREIEPGIRTKTRKKPEPKKAIIAESKPKENSS